MSAEAQWQRMQNNVQPLFPNEEQEYQAFGLGRVGNRPQMSITFEKANGYLLTLSYAHFYCVQTDNPGACITAEFSDHRIVIQGHNLHDLVRYLGDHKLRNIQESPPQHGFEKSRTTPVIESIKIVRISDESQTSTSNRR